MAKTKKLNKTGELGRTGLPIYAGRIYAEPLQKLAGQGWMKAIRDMTYNDPVIGAMQFAIEMLARQATWKIVPYSSDSEHEKDAQFARECIFEDMAQTWQETLCEILTMGPYGYAWLEMCYKTRGGESRDKKKNSRYSDGRVGFRKWALRGQDSLYQWKFDDFDDIESFVQMSAPDFKLREIPFEKSLHFRPTAHMQNPEGRSIYRNAYRPWFFKTNIENIEAIGIERELAGLPVIDVPADWFLDSASPDEKRMVDYAQDLADLVRNDEVKGVVMPAKYDDNKNRVFDIRLLSSNGKRQFDTSVTINRLDQRIAVCVLADFVFLGTNPNGSNALMDGKTGIFSNALSAWLDTICDTVNRRAIPKLQKLNGRPTDKCPYLAHGKVEQISLPELGAYVRDLSGANIEFTTEQEDYLKRRAEMPVEDE